jgi:hypothetical protein
LVLAVAEKAQNHPKPIAAAPASLATNAWLMDRDD